jgi:arylsulfatase
VVNRGFTVTARFDARQANGVIVAQGGTARGFALFLQDGKLNFLVRAGGEATGIAAPDRVDGAHTAVARLQADGSLKLTLDGKAVATGKAPGTIKSMPVDGLDIGSDSEGLVGPYTAENKFGGTIESVLIELE